MKKNIKLASLFMNVIAIIITAVMLIGTTFAWFSDSVSSVGNKIKSGTLKVDLEILQEEGWVSLKNSNDPIFDYENWEPGYTDVKILKVENEGTLALQWKAKFVSENELSALADVIDVYVLPSSTELAYPDSRDLTGYSCVGTVADFVNTIETTTTGVLVARESAYLGIALKMQESAGNEYQDLDLGGAFDIMIVATQVTNENDSFGNDYDAGATLNWTPVANQNQLRLALSNKEENILLTNNIIADSEFAIYEDANILGNGYAITRTNPYSRSVQQPYLGGVFNVAANQTLTLENIVVDGGAVWGGEVNAVLGRGTQNLSEVYATGALVSLNANSKVILGEGAILQNNDGANAVNLNTRANAQLILEGGEIINNHSAAGAIWGGGKTIINSGKINGNHGGLGGAIRVVTNVGGDGVVLEMNGGEMNHNLSDAVGGAIWAGTSRSSNVYILNGGEMAYNYSPIGGGAMYAGNYETVKIGGTFKMHDNDSPFASAIRFGDHASLVMTGGEIYDNGDESLFLYNNSTSITGGVIRDKFSYTGGLGLTMGNAQVEQIHFNLGTNHNTAYLAKEFSSFKFTVEENSKLSLFNFKPSADYVYVEGDEAKLICLNEGYEVYWDATTNTFRLQSVAQNI